MIYIVEGIDRVGKSTLCKLLSERLECKVFHDEFKPFYFRNKHFIEGNEPLVNEYLGHKFHIIMQMLGMFDNIVVDRLHMTEMVYNAVRGQKFIGYDKIDLALSKLNTKLILVEPNDVEKSSAEHGSNLKMHNTIFKVCYHLSVLDKIKVKQSDIFDKPLRTLEKILL